MATDTSASTPTQPGIFRLIWDLIRRPRSALTYLSEAGGKIWIWMAVLAMVAAVLPVIVAAPITSRISQEAMQAAMEAQGNQAQQTNPEIQQQIISFTTNPFFTIVMPAGLVLIGLWAGWLVWSAVLHFGGTLLGGNNRFGQMWQIVVWAWFPFAVRGLLQTIYILASGKMISNPGLSGLLAHPVTAANMAAVTQPPGQLALQALLSRIDLFLVWNLILLAIGVMVTARFSGRKATLITLGAWALFTLLAIGTAIIPGLLFAGSL